MSRSEMFTSKVVSSDSLNGLVFPLKRDRLPVHNRSEGRLYVPVDVIPKVRQERDGDLDPPDLMAGFLRAVVEVDAPVDNLYIIKGIL